ncbi:MAG: GAF domain-containing protein [Acidobacteria bacterium]|nr:GAF domain-containing protein [Acidobacteriota bacterium]
MSGFFGRKSRRYPLHVTMSAVFTTLLVIFGVALISFNYAKARSTAFLEADHQLDRIADHLRISVSDLYGPAQNVVDLASRMRLSINNSVEERRREMLSLAEALRVRREISSIFVGNEDGGFSLVRSLQGREAARVALDAPPEAQIALQIIVRSGDHEATEMLDFFDSDDRLVEHRETIWSAFDPREREWYRTAINKERQIATSAYVFFTTREVGVTIARRLAGSDGVVGVDLALSDLSAGLADHSVTPSSRLVLLNRSGLVFASSDPGFAPLLADDQGTGKVELPHLSELSDPVCNRLSEVIGNSLEIGKHEFDIGGRIWLASISSLPVRAGGSISLVALLPRDELLVDAIRTRNQSLLISLLMLVFTIGIALIISRHISGSLRILAIEAENIRELRFDAPITVHSRIREVADLAATMEVMKGSIQQFLAISHALSAEKSRDRLLEMILDEARSVCRADAGAVLLRTDDWQGLEVSILQNSPVDEFFGGTKGGKAPFGVIPLGEGPDDSVSLTIETRTVGESAVIRVDDITNPKSPSSLEIVKRHFDREGAPATTLLSAPLQTHEGEVIGVLQLVNARGMDGGLRPFTDETIPYIEALCSDAAVALDNRRLLKAHKDLLESFIHVLAGAIDAKSPYTHGHCRRVPVIARLLAEAAQEQQEGPFEAFHLSEDEWYELHIASWLHDCGKVTTPEYVVDKATKLETLGNRIHEIRTRFEVLWRDAEIEYLKENTTGADVGIQRRLDERLAELRDDFEFISRCNQADDPLSVEDVERIGHIGAQTWSRHFDDGLGLSHGERKLRAGIPVQDLPAVETLLADKPEHLVPREEGQHPFGDQPHQFKMDVPQHLYNRGELYNLKITRGTLTEEERFKINEHIIQTLRMLERLPFPRELKRVPQWAGTHHEKLDGTGYPCRLREEDLSIPERIMAVADVFEALTAADRPYMTPKSLSKAIWIMRSMAASGHLCPEVFALFLTSGVYRTYAEKHLQPEQLDEIDVSEILAGLSAP